MNDEIKIDIESDEQKNNSQIGVILSRRASSICCIASIACVAFIFVLPILLARILSYIIVTPIGLLWYYYKTYVYAEWLEEWSESLSPEQNEVVTMYINGPINITTFDTIITKIKPNIYVEITQTTTTSEREQLRYKYVPKYLLLSRFWPCYPMVDKPDFINGLTFMLNTLIKEKGESDAIQVNARFMINLLMDKQPQCSICMQEYMHDDIDELHLTKCYHLYHKKCIAAWGGINPICPICRRNITI